MNWSTVGGNQQMGVFATNSLSGPIPLACPAVSWAVGNTRALLVVAPI